MAKINWESIEGYKPELSAEDKLKLLENYELPEPDLSKYIAKSSFDKTASELAETKRQLKARLTEEEQKEAERQAAAKAMQDELESLRKDKAISQITAQLISSGYDAQMAAEAAEASHSGDVAKFVEIQGKFFAAREAKMKQELLDNLGKPPAGGKYDKPTQEQLDAMSDEDYYKTIKKE